MSGNQATGISLIRLVGALWRELAAVKKTLKKIALKQPVFRLDIVMFMLYSLEQDSNLRQL